MKKVSIFLVSSLITLSIGAQDDLSRNAQGNSPTLTIKVEGNRNKEVVIDGRSYTVSYNNDINSDAATVNMPISISDLQTGQHTLRVVRSNNYNNNTSMTNTVTFTLRSGYDLLVTVNSDGSIQQTETRIRGNWNSGNRYRTPMSDANFNVLLRSVQREYRTGPRRTLVTNAFANTGNYFTTTQARQLIQLVNSQSSRLQLAKSAYRGITDKANFSQLYTLLNSQASRNELASYVSVYDGNNSTSSNTGYYKIPMSDGSFMALYRNVQAQWQTGAKVSAVANIFTNTSNYYTTSQARQLIQLIPDESNRVNLAKLSFRGITDPVNFSQLYDLFTYPTSRKELETYVISYSFNNGNNNNNDYNSNNGNNNNFNIPVIPPMSDASFNAIYRDVQSSFGLGAKMSGLTNTFANTSNYFTTYQVKQLIQLVSDENNRLILAKSAYDNIVDLDNIEQLNDLFASQYTRNEFTIFVRSHNSNNPVNPVYNNSGVYNNGGVFNNTYRTPMSDVDFNYLYRNIQNQFGLGVKMSSLTDAFASTTNYFTTSQAKQMIELVSDENNRLQLAKASYDNIVDPANFPQLYDVLSSQASRNELAAYVSSYPYNR